MKRPIIGRPGSVLSTKVLAQPLSGKWYGPSPPHWLQGKNQRPSMSPAIAIDESQKRRSHGLENTEHHTPKVPQAIARLKTCGPTLDASVRRARNVLAHGNARASSLLRSSCSTLTPSAGGRWLGSQFRSYPPALAPPTTRIVRKAVSDMLIEAGITLFIGGIDFSVNEDWRTAT